MWYYTYILENNKGYQYIGMTNNLDDRISRHNRGEIQSTAKYKPWKFVSFTAFPTRKQASDFEKYLKSGSGTHFRHRHLASNRSTKLAK